MHLTALLLHAILITSTAGEPAVAIAVSGAAMIDTGAEQWPLQRFDKIDAGSTIATSEHGFVQLRLASGSLVKLGPNTTITVSRLEQRTPRGRRKENIKLKVGRIWARVTKLFGAESTFEVTTDNAVAGVRGTSFFAEAGPETSRFVLTEGVMELRRGEARRMLLTPGQFAEAGNGFEQGLGSVGQLPASALEDLFGKVGGPGGVMRSRISLPSLWQSKAQESFGKPSRSSLRRDIIGPGRFADTALDDDTTAGEQEWMQLNVQVELRD